MSRDEARVSFRLACNLRSISCTISTSRYESSGVKTMNNANKLSVIHACMRARAHIHVQIGVTYRNIALHTSELVIPAVISVGLAVFPTASASRRLPGEKTRVFLFAYRRRDPEGNLIPRLWHCLPHGLPPKAMRPRRQRDYLKST